jgi:hypothetical protein
VRLWSAIPIRVDERRFAENWRSFDSWYAWGGAFPGDDELVGRLDVVHAGLEGSSIEALRTEKCTARGVTFRATPGEREGPDGTEPDVTVRLP